MKSKTLKLYIWYNVLCDHTPGIAFAIASSKKEALELVAKSMELDIKNEWFKLNIGVVKPVVRKIEPFGEHNYGGG